MLNFGTWRSNDNAPIKKKRTIVTRPIKRPLDDNSSFQDSVTRPVKRTTTTTSGNAPTAEESFSSLKNEISLVEKSFEDCIKKKQEEEERLRSIKIEIEEYDKVLETREADLSLLEDLLGECKHQLVIKQIEIQNIDKAREENEREIKDLCRKIDAKKKQLEGEVKELDLKEEQLKDRANELDSKEDKLKSQMNELKLEKEQFEGRLEDLQSKEKLFEAQVKNFDSREEKFKGQKRELKSKKKKFEDQVKEFEGRKRAFELERGEYIAQMQQLKRFVRQMEDSKSEEKGRGKEVESREKQLEGCTEDFELRKKQHDALIEPFDEAADLGNQSSPSSEQNDELESVDDDIHVHLKEIPDPAKVVLEIIQNPIIQMEHLMGENVLIIDDGDILLLKELRKLSPNIRPEVREEAMKLALDVKAYISQNNENSAAVLVFLLLLSNYGLAPSFNEDEVFKLFGFAAQHEIAVELFGTLGFADKASDFVENLFKRQQYDEAVRFSRAYNFSDNNQLVALFEEHVQNLNLISESSCKETNSIEIKDKARDQEVASLMAVMQSIKDNNLEFNDLMNKIKDRIFQIGDHIFELRI